MLTNTSLTGLQGIAEAERDILSKQLEIQQDAVKQKLSEKQRACLQLFRLTKSTEDATYEWYKDRVDDRVEGTCMWFLEHEQFQEWLKLDSGPLLVSADPGCGKSVLAKYLIGNHLLLLLQRPRPKHIPPSALCSTPPDLRPEAVPDPIRHGTVQK
jgi:hypothetical protein